MFDIHLRTLLWVYCPGHAGVKGNDRADRLAGKAVAGFSTDLKCWGAWDTTGGSEAKGITPSIAWRREAWNEETLDYLPWKDERDRSRDTVNPQTLELCLSFFLSFFSFSFFVNKNYFLFQTNQRYSELLCAHQQAFRAYGRWAHTDVKTTTYKCTAGEQFRLANSK